MSRIYSLYLFSYNLLQAFGWGIALARISIDLVSTKSVNGAYSSAGELIYLLQAFGFLEVLHGAIGIVPSGFLFPLMQWGGRMNFLLVITQIYEVQELPAIFMTFVAWCSIEIIRYPYYTFSCLGGCPSFITYLRYTTFIVVYPTGVLGEMWLFYRALPIIREKNLFQDYFGALPFGYHTFLKVVLICYPFLWLQLYLYLFKQRRSKLNLRYEKKKRQ